MKFFVGFSVFLIFASVHEVAKAELTAGAAVVDVTPNQMPVLVNGGILSRTVDTVKTHVNARALALSLGDTRLCLVVVDSCMMPKLLLDDVKNRAAARTKLKPDQIMISATHTHTAPSSFGALGTDADLTYVPFLREKLVEAIVAAESNQRPAKVGWGSGKAEQFTALRRWVRRPDRVENDPFGNPTVRANMHAARDPDNVTGPSGPEDPELSMIAVQSVDGQPIAILTNFSMHYFGDQAISADYFGLFCDGLQKHARAKHPEADNIVGIMSHGCSGDIWRRDYMTWSSDQKDDTIEGYTQGLLQVAKDIYDSIEYTDVEELAMAEARLPMSYRLPDAQRLQWANAIAEKIETQPKDREEVYAREQVILNELQGTEVVVQAIRIGDIGIATTPNETYALTGLKLKLQSPLRHTMVIELANGADGYIPPPEQHGVGGYNTWAARSAGLEVQAEPRIVSTALRLLENISGKPRKAHVESIGEDAKRILDLRPTAYWKMAETEAPVALDDSGHQHDGHYEPGVLFFLEGPTEEAFTDGEQNRCAHFAGGRMLSRLRDLGNEYTVAISFWNGMPSDARATTGWLFSRDHAHATSSYGEHFGLGGKGSKPGRLIFQSGNASGLAVGKAVVDRWTWNRAILIRSADRARVYLNGGDEPDIDVAIDTSRHSDIASVFVGGRSDNDSNWEGRMDEVAIFDRALSDSERRSINPQKRAE